MCRVVRLLIAVFLSHCGAAFSCENREFPLELLGKDAYREEVNFERFLSVVEMAPSPESDLLPEGDSQSFFVVDRHRPLLL